MSERHQNEEEKIALYLDHFEAIQDVTSTFDRRWDQFRAEWPARLRDALEADGYAVTDWTFLMRNSDWGHIFRDGWWRSLEDLEPLEDRSSTRDDARVSLVHRLDRNRDLVLGERTLKVQFRNCGSNDQALVDAFYQAVRDARADIAELLPDAAKLTGNKCGMISARYDIEVKRHGDLFSAYIAALKSALADLFLDNKPLVRKLTDLYDRAVRQVYE